MVDQDELKICRQRGHDAGYLEKEKWRQCTACNMWLREVQVKEEREDMPPESEREFMREPKPEPVDTAQLVICRRRGHKLRTAFLSPGWQRCECCKLWTRRATTVEEREDDPPLEEMDLGERIARR